VSDEQLRADEAATILTAGHETTTLALSLTCSLPAAHTAVEVKLHAELDASLTLHPSHNIRLTLVARS
jgi:cytochrome P450